MEETRADKEQAEMVVEAVNGEHRMLALLLTEHELRCLAELLNRYPITQTELQIREKVMALLGRAEEIRTLIQALSKLGPGGLTA